MNEIALKTLLKNGYNNWILKIKEKDNQHNHTIKHQIKKIYIQGVNRKYRHIITNKQTNKLKTHR